MDAARFALFWSPLEPRLRVYLAACLGDPVRVDDLLQEVALALWRKRHHYRPAQDPLAWALGFARLALLRSRRDWARDRHRLDPDLVIRLAEELPALADELDRRRAALAGCRQELDSVGEELLQLSYGEGLALVEVARRLGRSHTGVRTALSRLRARLRACIEARLAGGVA